MTTTLRLDIFEQLRERGAMRRVRQLLTVFLCLQVLDVLTTLSGLRLGASESSIFVGRLLQFGPVTGLVLSKIVAVMLATAALLFNRERLVRFVNFWFVAVVGWNLVIITVAART
jgi:hypothetical protein